MPVPAQRNLVTTLRQRQRPGCPMAAYDRLPAALRRWLAGAALPWSPASALRIWRRAPGPQQALDRLSAAEAAALARERSPLRPPGRAASGPAR